MRVAVTGGTGLVGRFIVNGLLAEGHDVTVMTRTPPRSGFFSRPVAHQPFDLDDQSFQIGGLDAVVHAAFDHLPGRYRGGEGDDPEGFVRRNLDGSNRLFRAAEGANARVIFISSRAVYGQLRGALTEDMVCAPDTLYGQAKLQAEQMLMSSGQRATILRATGVYGAPGPGQQHKWADLFADFAAARPIAPRVGTEIHGDDLARAVSLGLSGAQGVYNLTDLLLDRRDLLAEWQRITGITGQLPDRADADGYGEMSMARLNDLGLRPGGMEKLRETLRRIAEIDGISSTVA